MRMTGLEPARRETLEPKSSASANSATSAHKTILNYNTADLASASPRLPTIDLRSIVMNSATSAQKPYEITKLRTWHPLNNNLYHNNKHL